MVRWLFRKIMREDVRKTKQLYRAYYICANRGYISAPNNCTILFRPNGGDRK